MHSTLYLTLTFSSLSSQVMAIFRKKILLIMCLFFKFQTAYIHAFKRRKFKREKINLYLVDCCVCFIFINQAYYLEWKRKWKVCINVNFTACQKSDIKD